MWIVGLIITLAIAVPTITTGWIVYQSLSEAGKYDGYPAGQSDSSGEYKYYDDKVK